MKTNQNHETLESKCKIGIVGRNLPHLFIIEGNAGNLVYHASQEALDLRFPFVMEMVYPTPWVLNRLNLEMDPEKVKEQIKNMFRAENILGIGTSYLEAGGVFKITGDHEFYGFPTTPLPIIEAFKDRLIQKYSDLAPSIKEFKFEGLPIERGVRNIWKPYGFSENGGSK